MNDEYFVDEDITRAESLPPQVFTCPDHLRKEVDSLFRRSWLFVPQRTSAELREDSRQLTDLISRRGSRIPITLLDKPLILQRDWEDGLHCFPNVCTHAWHILVEGPQRDRTITCPQHGRQFDCQGKFQRQAGFQNAGDDFPRECDHLQDFPIVQRDPFLWVCLGDPPAPIDEVLPDTPDMEFRRHPLPSETRQVAGNWKLHALNYLDNFHIGYIHRAPGGLADAVDLTSYQTEIQDWSVLQWAYAKDPDHGFDSDRLPERFRDGDRRVFALWWFLFPNVALNYYPWGLSVNVFQPIPDKPDFTQFLWYHYVSDEEKYSRVNDLWLNTSTDTEDMDALAQVRRGVRSGFAIRGRFAPESERGPHWFHRKVYESIFGDKK